MRLFYSAFLGLPSAWFRHKGVAPGYSNFSFAHRFRCGLALSALAALRYYDGSDSCCPSPRAAGLPACLATPTQHCASSHVMYPSIALHAKTQRTGRVSGFALREEARRHIPPNRVRYPAHCQFAIRLLPTPPRSDAVTFGYRVLACPDTDSHRADVVLDRKPSQPNTGAGSQRFVATKI